MTKQDDPFIRVEHQSGWVLLKVNGQVLYLRPSEAHALRDELVVHGSAASDYRWDYARANGNEYVEWGRPSERTEDYHNEFLVKHSWCPICKQKGTLTTIYYDPFVHCLRCRRIWKWVELLPGGGYDE